MAVIKKKKKKKKKKNLLQCDEGFNDDGVELGQLFQHLDSRLHHGGSLGVVSKEKPLTESFKKNKPCM